LDVVRVEVLQLEAVLKKDSLDELPSGDGEAALVEGHEREHIPPRQARHKLVAGHLPLHGGGKWRELTGLDEAKQLLTRHVGSRPVRHHSGEVLGGPVMQAVVALRMRKSKGNEAHGQKKKTIGK
jgi:hypothetical protein